MSLSLIPPLRPTFDAALRDVQARGSRFRLAAAARLAEPPPERADAALEGLLSLAHDPVGEIRRLAFESLGELRDTAALPVLVAGFDDRDPSARQAAVQAAVRVAPGEAKDVIEPLLDDIRADMRFQAVVALAQLNVTPDVIAGRLTDTDAEVRAITARSLGVLDARRHADAVARLVHDPSPGTRFEATLTLAGFGDRRAIEPLRRALQHRDTMFEAATALGELKATEAREELAQLAGRRFISPILRAAAAGALLQLGDPRGVDALRAILRSWRIEARSFAAGLVGELEVTELLDDLIALARSRRRYDVGTMKASLACFAGKSAAADKALESLADIGENDRA